jgi:hypothetical protein
VTKSVHEEQHKLQLATDVRCEEITLMKEAPDPSETLVLTRATRRNITEDTFLHSHRRENLESYIDTNFADKRLPPGRYSSLAD